MAYSTLTDITKLIPEESVRQLTDDEGLGEVNQARVAEAIAQADAEIDSYCCGRYTVPFASVPDVVRKLSADIAIYNLYSRKVEEIPSARAERYKGAIRLLDGIARGLIGLGVAPAPAAAADGGTECNQTMDDRVFTKEKLEGY